MRTTLHRHDPRSVRRTEITEQHENKDHLHILVLALAFTATAPSHACTGVTLKSKDRGIIFGRTMEWGSFDLHSRLVTVPRGHEYQSELREEKRGLTWKTKYGAVGVDVVNKDLLADGMIGLPGDYTPPSRFVRAVAFAKTARPTATGNETMYELLTEDE